MREFVSAEDFLAELSPSAAPWSTDRWLFRGHGDGNWSLLPSAHRGEAWEHFGVRGISNGVVLNEALERKTLERFEAALNDAGIAAPPSLGGIQGCTWPSEDQLRILALAQHQGFPTRLLDWTMRSRYAAHFAAVYAARKQGGWMDVWALNRDYVEGSAGPDANGVRIRIVSGLRAGNANLHAQAGLFTVCGGLQNGGSSLCLEEILSRRLTAENDGSTIALRRYRLPGEHAPTLLRLLEREGVTSAVLYPGFRGVLEAVRDEHFWDQPPPQALFEQG